MTLHENHRCSIENLKAYSRNDKESKCKDSFAVSWNMETESGGQGRANGEKLKQMSSCGYGIAEFGSRVVDWEK